MLPLAAAAVVAPRCPYYQHQLHRRHQPYHHCWCCRHCIEGDNNEERLQLTAAASAVAAATIAAPRRIY